MDDLGGSQHGATVSFESAFSASFADTLSPSMTPITFQSALDARRAPELTYVEFALNGAASWVAGFARGTLAPGLTGIFPTPDRDWACVVISGQAYLVNVSRPGETTDLPITPVLQVLTVVDSRALVLASHTALAIYQPGQRIWRSPDVSSDGIRALEARDGRVRGEGWSASEGAWIPFVIDLANTPA